VREDPRNRISGEDQERDRMNALDAFCALEEENRALGEEVRLHHSYE
jgi:hypothetical protein